MEAFLAALVAIFVSSGPSAPVDRQCRDTVVRHFTGKCAEGGGRVKGANLGVPFDSRGRVNVPGYGGCKGGGGGNCGVGNGGGGGNGTGNEGNGKGPKKK